MRAVPTRYDGVEFRSRTEAQWASVLRDHDIRYQYEPIVFFFGRVAPAHWLYMDAYLPDFWLPERRLWLEVKPLAPNITEYRKAALLAECTGSSVLITAGGPIQSEDAMLVKDFSTAMTVSTLDSEGLDLQIDRLCEAEPFETSSFRPFIEAHIASIETCGNAYAA